MPHTTQGADDAELIPPVPAGDVRYGDDDLLTSGDQRMPPTWVIVAGVGVLLAGAIALAVGRQSGHHAAPSAPSAIASATLPTQQEAPQVSRPIGLAATSAVDIAMAGGQLYVLTEHPARLGQVDARTGRTSQQAELAVDAQHVAVDAVAQLVWVAARDRVFAYDARTLNVLGEIDMSGTVSTVAALDGRLFVDTDHGIYQAEP
jgi:hypothetical protein